ncbi:MAG: ANTAR domain-containing protein [Nocardioides sp.]
MPTNHRVLSDDDARRASDRLVRALRRWREAERDAPAPLAPGLRAIDANRPIIEQAKGVLMLHFGVDSFQAFALLVRWSRATRTPVQTIAHALLHGICEGNPQSQVQQRPLIRWLEEQLHHGDPELASMPTAPTWLPAGE